MALDWRVSTDSPSARSLNVESIVGELCKALEDLVEAHECLPGSQPRFACDANDDQPAARRADRPYGGSGAGSVAAQDPRSCWRQNPSSQTHSMAAAHCREARAPWRSWHPTSSQVPLFGT